MRRSDRGAVAVVVAILIAVLLGFLALSLETGHLLSVRGELQNGADAAALAGAHRLDGTNEGFALEGARADALNYSRAHPTDRFDVEPATVQLGNWAPASISCASVGGTQVGATAPDGRKFCEISGTSAVAAAQINAVRVVTARAGTPGGRGGGAVAHPFGGFVGQAQSDVSAEAIAVTGSPGAQGCPEFPFAVKHSCVKDGGFVKCDGSVPRLFYVGMSASGIDSAGLTIFKEAGCGSATGADVKYNGSSGWGTNDICDVLNDTCEFHPVVGKCISIKNGTNVTGNCPDLGMKICNALREKVGVVGQIPLVEYAEGESCSGGFSDFNYTQAAKVTGIGSVRLVGARCETGSEKGVVAVPGYEEAVGLCEFASGSCFVMEFVCGEVDDDDAPLGYGWTGTRAREPALVR